MNPSDRHLLTAMSVRSGTSARCMAMAPPLRQRIQHHLCHQGQVSASACLQTWLCPRRRRNTLSPLWRRHGHAPRWCPRPDTHGHWQMAVTKAYGLYLAAYLVLQHGGLCQDDPATLITEPLITLSSTKPSTHSHSHITPSRTHRMDWATRL